LSIFSEQGSLPLRGSTDLRQDARTTSIDSECPHSPTNDDGEVEDDSPSRDTTTPEKTDASTANAANPTEIAAADAIAEAHK
jgi:hypothetical protein